MQDVFKLDNSYFGPSDYPESFKKIYAPLAIRQELPYAAIRRYFGLRDYKYVMNPQAGRFIGVRPEFLTGNITQGKITLYGLQL